jgi:cellulose synthase/poly-beta-1,6-N-acetylglucosamine synthase-like glycosyltransferase
MLEEGVFLLIVVIIIFFVSSMVLFWAFAGYPLTLYLLSKLRPNPVARRPQFPKVTVLVCTYNEAQVIERRIENLLESDYPLDKLEILVVDSASPDGTAEIVERFCGAHAAAPVRLLREDERRGKVSAINSGLSQAQGELIVLTDGPTLYWPDTIRLVVENFGDPRVGAVTGRWADYAYDAETPAQESRQPVIGFRNLFRRLESEVDSTTVLTGELTAFRKSLLPAIPSEVVIDDLYIALSIREQGYRVIADSRAEYTEKSPETYSELIVQKVNNVAGSAQLLMRFRKMFGNYRYGLYGLVIFPSRVMQAPLSPILVGLAVCSGIILAVAWLGIQISLLLALGLLILGAVLSLYRRGALLRPLLAFALSEWIIFRGLVMYMRGEYTSLWEKVASTRE